MILNRYVISQNKILRGWKHLPFALQDLATGQAEFFGKEDYLLLSSCDGKHDLNAEALSEHENKLIGYWIKNMVIHPAQEGEVLQPWQRYVVYPSRFKESVQWSITGKCNYNCRHCFMSAPEGRLGELPFEDCVKMLDAFERCGIRTIQLTGGEPLIREDFWDIVEEIQKRHLRIGTIFSNGLLVNESFLEELEKRYLYPVIQLSFDGIGWHDWLRGVPGAEKTVVNVLKACRDHNIPTSCSMCLFKDNKDTLRQTVNFLAELGCGSLKVNTIADRGEWLDHKSHGLTPEEAYQIYLDYIPHYFEDGKPMPVDLAGFFTVDDNGRIICPLEHGVKEERFDKVPMCGYLWRNLYVDPQGRVLPCMSMSGSRIEGIFPNMLEQPLEEILEDSYYWRFADTRVSAFMEHNPECKTCRYRTDCCGGCRSLALGGDGQDYLTPDQDACLYFKGGWKDKKDALLASLNVI